MSFAPFPDGKDQRILPTKQIGDAVTKTADEIVNTVRAWRGKDGVSTADYEIKKWTAGKIKRAIGVGGENRAGVVAGEVKWVDTENQRRAAVEAPNQERGGRG